jgi:murein DD-endopeptidase MepM/ murein hydrolase activator NlpD
LVTTLHRVGVLSVVVTVLGLVTPAIPALAATTTTGPTTTAPKKGPTTTTTTTSTIPSEVPPDEAELEGLLANVRTRLAQLTGLIADIDARIASNQQALAAANAAATASEAQSYAADRHLDTIEVDRAAARQSVRDRAIAAYMHQPTGDLVNLFLHLNDPAELVDVRSFYNSIVDVQVKAIQNFDHLDHDASGAAQEANKARDAATKLQAAVSKEQSDLEALRQTLEGIQATSNQQEQQQTSLLGQLGQDRTEFEAELQAQEEESASITDLLQSLSTPGETTATPTSGYFTFPIPGAPITQPFGPNRDPFTGAPGFHPGIDFGAREGTPIDAAGDGTVVFAGEESGYGNYTCINHGSNVATCYGHQSDILVQVGEHVLRGQVIGLVGSTGYSTGPHLHFEVRVNGTPVDPLPWLTNAPASTTTEQPPNSLGP